MTRALALCAIALHACAGSSRDVVPETHDVQGATPAPSASPDGYVYVAKRPRGVVALAEARGMSDEAARQAIDHLADELDACAARLAGQKRLAKDGAGRVVAAIGADGTVQGLNVKAAPGENVAANFVLCVVSPLRMTIFPAADAGARGIAVEATWGTGA